jgi:hypothetical protein
MKDDLHEKKLLPIDNPHKGKPTQVAVNLPPIYGENPLKLLGSICDGHPTTCRLGVKLIDSNNQHKINQTLIDLDEILHIPQIDPEQSLLIKALRASGASAASSSVWQNSPSSPSAI